MIKKSLIVLVILLIISLSVGCSSQTESSANSNVVIPSPTIKDLHNVEFHFVDQNDTPIYNAYVTANYNSSAYIAELNTPNNNRRITDEYGNCSFVMRGSIKYDLIVSNFKNEQIFNMEINPTEKKYFLKITPKPTQSPEPIKTNSYDHINDNNWFLQIAKGICSLIPTINKALNCLFYHLI